MNRRHDPTTENGTAKPATIGDVAARVGVSKALVSLVLRDEPGPSSRTRERVLRAAEELGYRSNRTASLLARRRTRLLGVMLSVRNAFHTELVEELHAAADQHGYEPVLSAVTSTHDESRAVETLLGFRCEALVLLGPESTSDTIAALAGRVPVIVLGRRTESAPLDVVRTADDDGVGRVVDHLVELGHRDIVHVDGGSGAIAADRRTGYREAARRHGLDASARVLTGAFTEEEGARAARAMLAQDHLPTAVMAANDRCAIGVLDTFVRAGVDVPGTVSVAGYDDSALARLAHVDLTTVNQDAPAQAAHAVTAAVERLDGGRTEWRDIVLSPSLVIRGTTGPARSG